MLGFSHNRIFHFGVAILAVGVALILSFQFEVLAGRTLLMFAAVMLAAWLGGKYVGIFALVLATSSAWYYILAPPESYQISKETIVRLGVFIALGIPIIWLITAHREKERILATSEARYRLLFDNNPVPMWVVDVETLEYLAVNDAATLSYGYSREEFLSMTAKMIRPAEDLPAFLSEIAGNRPPISRAKRWRHLKKDGIIIDVEINSHELTFKGRPSRLVLATDVTERLKVETEVKNSEYRLKTIVENLTEGLAAIDLEGRIIGFNRAALDMHGFASIEELPTYVVQFSKLFTVSDLDGNPLDRDELPLARILGGEQLRNVEIQIERNDRPFKRTCNIGGSIIYDEDSKPMVVIVTIADITKRKKAEDQIRRMNETLESQVAMRTAELQAVNKELESFSYSVSHDLRAPVRHIAGFSKALAEDYGNLLDDKGKEFLNEVRNATEEMGHLIDDVLKLSRVTQSEILREEIDFSELSKEVVGRLRKTDPTRSIDITIEDGLLAYGDWRLLNVVLTNLLENAWKFTSKRENAKISFCSEPVVGACGYVIRDNGSGFDMKYAEKLFGAFQRLHTVDEFEGTGIGLATVQRIINRHGGQIWAEGEVDGGASFYFTLPESSQNEFEERDNTYQGREA